MQLLGPPFLLLVILSLVSYPPDEPLAFWQSPFMPCSLGFPLTALLKKGKARASAQMLWVKYILRHLASCLCLFAVCLSLPGVFLPYGQVRVGILGGLAAAIHVTHHHISQNASDSTLELLNIDMKNALVVQLFSLVLLMISWRFLVGLNGAIHNPLNYVMAHGASLPLLGCNKVTL